MRTCVWIALLTGMAALLGCAPAATVQAVRPASLDVHGIGSLAVLDFDGPQGSGAIARSAVVSHLSTNGHYSLVDKAQLQNAVGSTGELPVPTAIEAARRLNVDAVLKGQVISYHVTDDVYNDQNIQVSDHGFGFENNETVDRDATVTLSFELIDAQTGQVRAARSTSHSFVGRMVNGQGNLPARDRILQELLQTCASDIVVMLAPHSEAIPVDLALPWFGTGSGQVRKGVKHAAVGRWDLAEQEWRDAIAADASNHSAHFNLAMAARARHDYFAAEDHLARALELNESSLYMDAMRKTSQDAAQFRLASQQSEARGIRTAAIPPQRMAPPQAPTSALHQAEPIPPGAATPQFETLPTPPPQ